MEGNNSIVDLVGAPVAGRVSIRPRVHDHCFTSPPYETYSSILSLYLHFNNSDVAAAFVWQLFAFKSTAMYTAEKLLHNNNVISLLILWWTFYALAEPVMDLRLVYLWTYIF